jgi:RNA polymerase sigma-54 factor
MKPSLQLKLSQHLTLTPQLQQSIRLLQLSTLELNQEIEGFLQDNPLLERESGSGEDGAMDWFSEGGGGSSGPRSDDDDNDYQDIQAASTTLRDHLSGQLALTQLSDRDRSLVRFVIEAIDDDGYLTQSLEDLLPLLPEDIGFELEELADRPAPFAEPRPAGHRCAQRQSECLCAAARLQHAALVARPATLALRHRARSISNTSRRRDFVKHQEGALGPIDTRYVIPDVAVKKAQGRWVVSLNRDAMPRLRINRLYADILQRHRSGGNTSAGLAGQLQEAKWLIKNVQQRFDTILRVSQCDRRSPARTSSNTARWRCVRSTLREIAEILGLHESTVSRVTTQKFMSTPRGIFELKYFFGSHVSPRQVVHAPRPRSAR